MKFEAGDLVKLRIPGYDYLGVGKVISLTGSFYKIAFRHQHKYFFFRESEIELALLDMMADL